MTKKHLNPFAAALLTICIVSSLAMPGIWPGDNPAYATEQPVADNPADPGHEDEAGPGGPGEEGGSADGLPGGPDEGPGPDEGAGDAGEGDTGEDYTGDEPGEEEENGNAGETTDGAEDPDQGLTGEAGAEDEADEIEPAAGTVRSFAEGDPIVIESEDNLAEIGQNAGYPLDGSYILSGNITLSDEWEPLGSATEPFTGEFDGAGYKISNLMVDFDDGNAGLFSDVGNGAKIKNLTIEAAYVRGGSNTGAFAGVSTNASFEGCFAIAGENPFDEPAAVEGALQAGGLVGLAAGNTTFTGCGSAIMVVSANGWAGGLAGQITGTSSARAVVERSHASGAVEQAAEEACTKGAGGLIGSASYTDIRDCYASGNVSAQYWYSGGLVGSVDRANIERCMASGNVRSYRAGAAGIAYGAGSTSQIRSCAAVSKYLAVFDLRSKSCPVTTSTPATSLSGNIHYAPMVYTATGDTTDEGDPKSMSSLRSQSSYTALGWNFSSVWQWDNINDCPKLRTGGPQAKDTLGLSAQAPQITSGPSPSLTYLFATEKLELSVTASGAGLSYQWYRDGEALEDSDPGEANEEEEFISGARAAKLSIDNIELLPSSAYVVEARNSYGETVSWRSIVNVSKGASAPIVTDPQNQAAFDGQRAEFSITAENKEGETLSYRWEKSSDGGLSWATVVMARSNVFTTSLLSVSDSGDLYRCVVTNTLGPTSKSVTTGQAELTVLKSVKSVEISETRIIMKKNEKIQMEAQCLPVDADQDRQILWIIGSGSTVAYVDIDTGEVGATGPGVATLLAVSKANSDIFQACFIVVEEDDGPGPGPAPIPADTGPRLPVKTVTVFSKSSEGTPVAILPCDGFPFDTVKIAGVKPAPKAGGFAIASNDAPIHYVSAMGVPKGKYVLELRTEKDGLETGPAFSLTVNVSAKMPVAKVKLPSLNTFYVDEAKAVKITGKGLPVIERVELVKSGRAADGDVTQNFGIYEYDGRYMLYCMDSFGSLLKGKPSVKGVLRIWYRGFAEPFDVKVKIPAKPKPPKTKFLKSKLSIDPSNGLTVDFDYSGGFILNAGPSNEKKFYKSFEGYGYDTEENTISLTLDYDVFYNGKGNIRSAATGKSYSANMDIWLENARAPVVLKAVVNVLKPKTAPSFRLSKKSVTANKRFEGQRLDISVNCSQKNTDFSISRIICSDRLDISNFGEHMTIMAGPSARTGTYACKAVITYNRKTTVLPFSVTVIDKALKVSLTGKKGKINLLDRENTSVSYKPKLTNYQGDVIDAWIVDEEGEGLDEMFSVSLNEKGRLEIRANDGLGYDDDIVYGKTYKLKLGFTLEAANADVFGERYYESYEKTVVSVKPVRSKVKHGYPKTVTMYLGRASDMATIDLSPVSPPGARVDVDSFNIDAAKANGAFFLYLDDSQILHIMIRDASALKPGKKKLTMPVLYEGQGLVKSGRDLVYKPAKISVNISVKQ